MRKWDTDDDCPGCGEPGLIFFESRRTPDEVIGDIIIGRLSCAVGGWEDACSYCYDYQVPPAGETEKRK
jgi:hypothetical protein